MPLVERQRFRCHVTCRFRFGVLLHSSARALLIVSRPIAVHPRITPACARVQRTFEGCVVTTRGCSQGISDAHFRSRKSPHPALGRASTPCATMQPQPLLQPEALIRYGFRDVIFHFHNQEGFAGYEDEQNYSWKELKAELFRFDYTPDSAEFTVPATEDHPLPPLDPAFADSDASMYRQAVAFPSFFRDSNVPCWDWYPRPTANGRGHSFSATRHIQVPHRNGW